MVETDQQKKLNKLDKGLAIAVALVVIFFIVFQTLERARSHSVKVVAGGSFSGLEPDRIAPPKDQWVESNIGATPGKRRYAIYNYINSPSHTVKPLYLAIPNEFVGDDPGYVTHAWGVNLFVWYPKMTGVRNPDNKPFLDCGGSCNNRMLLSITNGIGNAQTKAERARDSILRDMQNPTFQQYVIYKEIPSNEFTRVIEKKYKNEKMRLSDKTYFIKEKNGIVEFFADCSVNTPFQGCDGYTTASPMSGIDINYYFDMALIHDWQVLQNNIQQFVVGLISTPPPN